MNAKKLVIALLLGGALTVACGELATNGAPFGPSRTGAPSQPTVFNPDGSTVGILD